MVDWDSNTGMVNDKLFDEVYKSTMVRLGVSLLCDLKGTSRHNNVCLRVVWRVGIAKQFVICYIQRGNNERSYMILWTFELIVFPYRESFFLKRIQSESLYWFNKKTHLFSYYTYENADKYEGWIQTIMLIIRAEERACWGWCSTSNKVL